MKRILLLFGFFVITTTGLYAQVGIGTRDPHPTAQLEVKAKNKGVLIPRVKLEAIKNQSPIVGTMTNSLLVYNTATNTDTKGEEVYPGYYFWYNKAWNRVVSQEDFSNTNITNKILKGSNIVTYNSKSNTLNYYTKDGTSTSVSIVDVINNTDSSTTIDVTKIEAGSPGQVLTTNSSSVVEWQALSSVLSKTLEKTDLKLGKGLEFDGTSPGVTSKTATDLVFGDKSKPVTLKVKDLDLSALKGAPGKDGRIITVDKDGNLTATETIKIKNIKGDPGKDGQILTVDNNGVVTYTNEIDASKIQSSNLTSTADSGVKITNGEGVVLGENDVTISIDGLDISKVNVGGNKGDIITVGDGNKVTYTSTISADKIQKGDLLGGDGVTINDGTGKLLGSSATIEISGLPVTKLAKGSDGQVITSDGSTVKWGKLSGDNITGKKLTGIKGIKVESEDNLALLQSVTLSVDELPIASIDPAGGNDKLLTVKGGKVTWTNELPGTVSVSVTNIKGEKGVAGPGGETTTKVVVIDPATGNATTTSITDLVSNTVKVGNGLSKDGDGKIVLGGKLEKAVTTITTNDKKLAITGLTNTDTTADDKVMVLGKGNVLHTVSITSLKGSGDYTVVKSNTTVSKIKDNTTGNTFTDEHNNKKTEYVRTVLVTAKGKSWLEEDVLNVGNPSEVIITEVKVMGAEATYRGVLSSSYGYSVNGSKGVIGLGLPSGDIDSPNASSILKDGTKWYVTIKYAK